jgi:acetate kinase
VIGGIDALVFTAGIGENSAYIRTRVSAGLKFPGIRSEKTTIAAVDGSADIIVWPRRAPPP